jgi:coenzyme F420-reducing hydrogenase alpha subunit
MSQREVEVGQVTRIEGLLKVSIDLNESGNVKTAHANLLEFRGFEKFLIGRLFYKMPMITTRICGVCPVPHHLAAAKACDSGLGLEIPPTAAMLRELMLTGEYIGDHTLQIFVLGGPDLLLSDLPESKRGIVELYKRYPDVVKEVVGVRSVVQELVSTLGVQAVHPMTAIPGGINKHLSSAEAKFLLSRVREAKEKIVKWHDSIVIPIIEKSVESYRDLAQLKTSYLGLVKNNNIELYDGACRIVTGLGDTLAEFRATDYLDYLQERTVSYSYAKRVFLKSLGIDEGIVRVGALARVNVAKGASTEFANRIARGFKKTLGSPSHSTLSYYIARYVCLAYAVERAEQLLEDPKITGADVKVPWKMKAGEGVGVVEAPRGLLIHHYAWDNDGYITKANLIVPTTTNSYPIDMSMKSVAQRSISKGQVDEEKLRHEVGLAVRAYDPCISCSTHLDDSLLIELKDAQGCVVRRIGGETERRVTGNA